MNLVRKLAQEACSSEDPKWEPESESKDLKDSLHIVIVPRVNLSTPKQAPGCALSLDHLLFRAGEMCPLLPLLVLDLTQKDRLGSGLTSFKNAFKTVILHGN